jgi:hypothetical protein
MFGAYRYYASVQTSSSTQGIVAKTREYAITGPRPKSVASDCQPKQLIDKLQLGEWVTFAHPSGSRLPNHVDRLDSL